MFKYEIEKKEEEGKQKRGKWKGKKRKGGKWCKKKGLALQFISTIKGLALQLIWGKKN